MVYTLFSFVKDLKKTGSEKKNQAEIGFRRNGSHAVHSSRRPGLSGCLHKFCKIRILTL